MGLLALVNGERWPEGHKVKHGRVGIVILSGAVVAACLSLLQSDIAAGYIKLDEPGNCNPANGEVAFRFQNGDGYDYYGDPFPENWTTGRKEKALEGATAWNVVNDPDGGFFVDVSEDQNASGVMLLNDFDPLGGGAGTDCSSGLTIEIDNWESDGSPISYASLKGLATHEMGHALGPWHSGPTDSWEVATGQVPNSRPSMATCDIVSYENYVGLAWDDFANLGAFYLEQDEDLLANRGFEDHLKSWKPGTGASLHVYYNSQGAARGNRYVTVSGGAIRQTIRVVEPPQYLRATVANKAVYPAEAEDIRIQIWVRRVSYLYYDAESCGSPNGVDLGIPSYPDGMDFSLLDEDWVLPGSSWSTDWVGYAEMGDWDGADIRIRVVSNDSLTALDETVIVGNDVGQ